MNFDLNYLRTGVIEWAEKFFRISLSKSHLQIFFSRQGAGMAWTEGRKANIFNVGVNQTQNDNSD